MAASLRAGFCRLLRGCQTWTQAATSPTSQVLKFTGQPASVGSGVLSSFTARSFGSLSCVWKTSSFRLPASVTASKWVPLQPFTPRVEQVRTKIRYSCGRGKPKSVKSVPARFYRLRWGAWIRTRAGRGKRLWRKNPDRRYRLRQHVFCNKTQSKLLDRMVTRFWRRPKYYVDDPYEPYHKRENFDMYYPQKSRPFYP